MRHFCGTLEQKRNAEISSPSIHPSIPLSYASSISPTIPVNVRNMLMPVMPLSLFMVFPSLPLSLCVLICTFIFLVSIHFVVLHLTVSHTICLLSLSFCLLLCVIELSAHKTQMNNCLPLYRETGGCYGVPWTLLGCSDVKQLLKYSRWLLCRC